MNFMTQEWATTIERRQKSKEFWKQIVIPAIIIGATVIFSIVMIKFGYDYAVNLKSSTGAGTGTTVPQTNPNPNIPIVKDLLPGT